MVWYLPIVRVECKSISLPVHPDMSVAFSAQIHIKYWIWPFWHWVEGVKIPLSKSYIFFLNWISWITCNYDMFVYLRIRFLILRNLQLPSYLMNIFFKAEIISHDSYDELDAESRAWLQQFKKAYVQQWTTYVFLREHSATYVKYI